MRFFGDPWRVFDLVVVGIAIVPAGSALVLDEVRALRQEIQALRGPSQP